MALRFRHLLLTLVAVLVLLAAGLWLARERLVREVLRPWLVTEAARVLDGEVVLDDLRLAWGRVELQGLRLAREGLDVDVDALRIAFTFDGLLLRRLEEVVVLRPDVHLKLPLSDADEEATPLSLPGRAPFSVTAWTIEEGRLQVDLQDDSYVVRELAANGNFGEELHFVGAARVGAGEGVGVTLNGGGLWQDGLELTLEELAVDERPLLAKPVTVRPEGVGDLQVEVALPSFSSVEASGFLAAIDRPVPWPEGMQWQVTSPAAVLRLAASRPVLRLRTGAGTVTHAGRSWPWDNAVVGLEQIDDAWTIDVRLGLPAGALAEVTGEWRNDAFSGSLKATVPQPAQLANSYDFKLPEEARRGRSLVVTTVIQADQNHVRISEGRFSLDWADVGRFTAHFKGDWLEGKVAAQVERLNLSGRAGTVALATAALDLTGDPAAGAWQGRWQLAAEALHALARAAGVAVTDELPDLREVRLAGNLKVLGERIDIPDVKLAARLEGKGLSGRLTGRLSGSLDGKAATTIDLQDLSLDEVEYSNAEGTVVAVGGRLALAGQVRPAADAIVFDLRGRGGLEEALAGSWYGSLQDLPLGISVRGSWLQDGQTVQLERASLDFDGLAAVDLNGRISARTASLDGRLAVPRLAGRFLNVLQRLAGEIAPALKEVNLEGALAVQGDAVRAGDVWRLDLELQPDGLDVGMGDTFVLSGLHGSLPFILQTGELQGAPPERSGRLTWARLKAPLVDATDGQLEIRAATNRWQLVRSLAVPAAGGRVSLDAFRLSWQDLVPEGEASLRVEEVELLQVSRAFSWPELGGRFTAALDGIRFSEKEIVTSGEASARAFGGAIRLQNLKVLAPLSRYPTYHADIDFNDIDLYELTRTFAFGEINGIASGHVRGLRLFDGIPSAFDARFETAESGTRNISVKAIRNLNTLSHGGLSAALSQGVYRFIDFYRYRKIGLACTLRNDVFRLRGAARAESEKYLIDGGWLPPKIDVIVSSPVISFKEMVKRLKRIERTEH